MFRLLSTTACALALAVPIAAQAQAPQVLEEIQRRVTEEMERLQQRQADEPESEQPAAEAEAAPAEPPAEPEQAEVPPQEPEGEPPAAEAEAAPAEPPAEPEQAEAPPEEPEGEQPAAAEAAPAEPPAEPEQAEAPPAPEPEQPAAAPQQAAPAEQPVQAQQQAAPAEEEGDESGVSRAEALTAAGLALAPWLLQALGGGGGAQPQQGIPSAGPPPYVGGPAAGGGWAYAPFPEEGRAGPAQGLTGAAREPEARTQARRRAVEQLPPITPLDRWDYPRETQAAWRAERLLGSPVYDRTGRQIGTLENLLVSPRNRLAGAMVELRDVWGQGPTIINVPWEQVNPARDGGITVPVTANNIDRYALFGPDSVLTAQGSVRRTGDGGEPAPLRWKVTDLLDDYVILANGAGYGYVDDVVFDRQGRIEAVVVYRDLARGQGGSFAMPFYGIDYGFNPWVPYYALPYGPPQMADAPAFDAGRWD